MSATKSWIYLLLCNLMWSLQFTCIKLVQDQVGPFATVWGPMTLATLMLYPLVRREAKSHPQKGERGRKDILLFMTLALLGVFPGQFFVTWGTQLSLASNAALLMLTLPICTAFMAYLFLGEKMTGIRWVSFAFALVGVVMCSEIDFGTLNFGATYLAGNALIFAGMLGCAYYNSYGKKVLQRYSPLELLFYTYVAMFVIMTPLTLATEADVFARIPNFTLQTWIGLLLLIFFHNYLSMVLFLKALDYLDAIQAALSNYLITFFGLPISAIWLGERLTPMMIAGGVIVLLSTLLITVWEERKRRSVPAVEAADPRPIRD
ncbi:MAG TPA: DMT family transporter [Bryobacteraceae bacterium]|nr:DMT family transporter [Bryobacteraceae bacterium]